MDMLSSQLQNLCLEQIPGVDVAQGLVHPPQLLQGLEEAQWGPLLAEQWVLGHSPCWPMPVELLLKLQPELGLQGQPLVGEAQDMDEEEPPKEWRPLWGVGKVQLWGIWDMVHRMTQSHKMRQGCTCPALAMRAPSPPSSC